MRKKKAETLKWFFADPARVDALIAEARSWWGTPFAYFSRAKGPSGGIDCMGFVEEVTATAGLERFAVARTDEDYSRHVHNDKILNNLRGLDPDPISATLAARWVELPVVDGDFVDPPMVGDLLILKDAGGRGTGVFHMPLMISPTLFMHCAPRLGVIEGQIDDPTYRSHLVAHFRARVLD